MRRHRPRVLHHNRVLGGVCTCGNPDGGRCEPDCGMECPDCGEFHTGRCEPHTLCCDPGLDVLDHRCRNCPGVSHAA